MTKPAMAIATKTCGCVVGASRGADLRDRHDVTTVVEWLRDGLVVRLVSFESWQRDYLPVFLNDCPHESPAVSLDRLAPSEGE